MLLAAWLLACTADRPEPAESVGSEAPLWMPPDQPGPYAVGVRTLQVPATAGGTLTVDVWYPAIPGDGAVGYELAGIPVGGTASRDAPLDRQATLGPVVAFSHGFGGMRFQSWFLTEHLASHGMVVVAPDHPGTTLLDFEPDGLSVGAPRRPADVVDAVDALSTLGWPVDAEAYAVVGHSFGAWTALVVGGGRIDAEGFAATCATSDLPACGFLDGQVLDAELAALWAVPDPRATVTVALAPGAWYAFSPDGSGLSEVRSPLVLGGSLDSDLPWAEEGEPTWQALRPPRALGLLQGAGHWGFTDLCGLLPVADCAGASAGFLEPERVQAITRQYVTAWIRSRLSHSEQDQGWLTPLADVAWTLDVD